MSEKIKALFVQVHKLPELLEIENSEKAFKNVINTSNVEFFPYFDDVHLILDDSMQPNKEFNRSLKKAGNIDEIIKGNFIIAGLDYKSGGVISLTEQQIQKYEKIFKVPEFLLVVDNKLKAYPDLKYLQKEMNNNTYHKKCWAFLR